ncbi:hypothetical protein KXX26_008481, partial [Aspergillus fumigatus]
MERELEILRYSVPHWTCSTYIAASDNQGSVRPASPDGPSPPVAALFGPVGIRPRAAPGQPAQGGRHHG